MAARMRTARRARWVQRTSRAARRDAGMATSEYAMGLLAAVAFAGVLYKVVTSGSVKSALQSVIQNALNVQV